MRTIIDNAGHGHARAIYPDASSYQTFGSVDFTELHPDTSPEAIATVQRADIAAVMRRRPRASPEEVSEIACLPVWVVRRRLGELGLGPRVEMTPCKQTNRRPATPKTRFNRRRA